ncbi:hypothetical protein V1633_31535 [Plantactinospora sonchi]|uniref:Uncharacterized protein n=1 Tax=Plantactinospora sonchi TaxID=1544735 RepID=A0ABU7S2Q4_9ACTN
MRSAVAAVLRTDPTGIRSATGAAHDRTSTATQVYPGWSGSGTS